ncbi:hypothetical protein OCH239_20400 [Roseivivax halodurans JCM 10272]|uniref:Uncharacterized protein n=1 Tax=Roseivivax halodurans JCM 10272 TaxID=1449350 RepID=X7EHV9_9RHOB|nr:hypothetical protein [Roseivivax halodurans]ETX14728.1 hypothetical protein OCH239_20400 [Roseivivax halodurans JCM 10272]
MSHTARRFYLRTYRAWLEADRTWQLTITEAKRLVPDAERRIAWQLGQSNSRVRHAWEARTRAIEVLHQARAAYLAQHRPRSRLIVLSLPSPRRG